MAKANRKRPARVNFFDGQRVTESDLDAEQIHHRSLVSDLAQDFHASGVVRDRLFESRVLFNTSRPGIYADDGNEATKLSIEAGNYDGKALAVDRQPSDLDYGNRLEIEAKNLVLGGSVAAKVLILGTTYSSLKPGGELISEIVEFSSNTTKITEFYYTKVIAVLFNNLSGGVGRTEVLASAESFNTTGQDGGIIIREAEPLKVFSKTNSLQNIDAPNVYLRDFITSNVSNKIEDEIKIGLGTSYSINQLYFELNSKEKVFFEKDGNQTVAFGQKFLAKSNNLQRLDILLSVLKNEKAPVGSEFDFSGEIVVSIHRLSTDIKCITDPNPENLLDFDPEQSPLMELSYSSEDFAAQGIILSDIPQIVSFDFSGTLLADPQIEPSLVPQEFYAFLISRRGDNRTGTLVLERSYNKASRKRELGQDLNVLEQFGRSDSRYIEYDPFNLSFVDDSDSSLWYIIYSNSVEVTDGSAYSDDGYPISVPKTEDYVGSTEISKYLRDIDLVSVSEGSYNYVVMQRKDSFVAPNVHPRTGNFVNTRIEDSPEVFVVSESDLSQFPKEHPPIILARVSDKNIREAQDISGLFDKPGMIRQDEIIIINPDASILEANLVGRVFTPDIDCDCTSRYRIVEATCLNQYIADLDNDGVITNADILQLLNVVGNTINAETTERRILGGELDLIDFVKSDLNGDGTVDGTDISLAEDALDGKVDFGVEEKFNLLRIRVENVLEDSDYPVIFDSSEDPSTLGSASTSSGQDVLTFNALKEEQALAIRGGDRVIISSGSADSGEYVVYSKIVDETALGVSLGLLDGDKNEVSFSGVGGLDIEILSGSATNMLADNLKLSKVPFETSSWIISHEEYPHQEEFVDVCDLRRYVETNFIEEYEEKCKCSDDSCISGEICSPQYRNQKVLANDLFIPNGEIYSKPGVPYHGDIEYASISIPLPPGSVDDCAIDLYTNFIKSDGGSCWTASGYPAMRFSDGTYVGCEDSGLDTDITKGRVKIEQCIASLYVDSFVDGYAVDGYADESETYTASEIITESLIDHTYPNNLGFTEWPNISSGSYINAVAAPGPNEPVYFDLSTINAGYRFARIEQPVGTPDLEGDFVVDFIASRNTWDDGALLFGDVSFFATVDIQNDDGTESVINFGWKQRAYEPIKLFYSGVKYDSATGSVLSDFYFEKESTDDISDEIKFRIRRKDEAIFALYFDPTLIENVDSIEGGFVRLGELVSSQPGSGSARVSFELSQDNEPNTGLNYACTLHDFVINSSYTSETAESGQVLPISRDADGNVERLTATFPLLLTRRTNIISAALTLTAEGPISSTESFNVIPYSMTNADNLGTIIDYPLEDNHSFVTTFTPGTLATGETVEIDITGIAIYFLSQPGHLPGFYKAISIEPSASAIENFIVSTSMTMTIEYEDITTGVVFKIGASIDSATGVVSLQTKNILYDAVNEANRTVLNFGVHLKKSGFKNKDVKIGIKDLARIGIGTCLDETQFEEDELCFFIAGSTATGTFVEGPFPCFFHLP